MERVVIDALNDIPQEPALMQEVVQFIDSLKAGLVPELNKTNKANKATVGTFFGVHDPKNAMRTFGIFISKIDWSKSASLNSCFYHFSTWVRKNLVKWKVSGSEWKVFIYILFKNFNFNRTLTTQKHFVKIPPVLSHHQQETTKKQEENKMVFEIIYSILYLLALI